MHTRAQNTLAERQYQQRRASREQPARQLGLGSLREVPVDD
jgi:galactokinase